MAMERNHKPRGIEVPHDLKAALREVNGATAAFENSSPSHREENVAWIASAKKPETRRRRIEKTIEMISQAEGPKG